MDESGKRIFKSSQEQAIASWITYLNQCRLDELVERINQQDINLESALIELSELKSFIGDTRHILGNVLSKHGEIAEHMQVNISNARKAVEGLAKEYSFEDVGRTAAEDYMQSGHPIQSKFCNALNRTIFNGLDGHMKLYPDFLSRGGAYDIPKDQYEEMIHILDLYKEHPSKLSNHDYFLAQKIDKFLKDKGLELGKDIRPAVVDYKQTQVYETKQTISDEEQRIHNADRNRRVEAYKESKPTIEEGVKASGISAVIEGGVAFCISVAEKRKEKNFSDFTENDWKEIGLTVGYGTLKGGVRGGTIYIMTNFTATPANVASAYVTAAFGVAAQVKALERGEISKEDFVINCETVCLDVSVSAIASLVGQILIPIPVLGAVIGNVAGEFAYELCKKQGMKYSQHIISNYNDEMKGLEQKLSIQYMSLIMDIMNKLRRFENLEKLAFDTDVNVAFEGSIKLAREVGVDENMILHNLTEIDNYFML